MHQTQEPRSPEWRKSRRSHQDGACVEVATLGHSIAVRDSHNPQGPKLALSRAQWRDLTRRVMAGALDL
jgi:hypothetical protein